MSRTSLVGTNVLKAAQGIGNMYGFAPLSHVTKRGLSRAPFPDSLKIDSLDKNARELAYIVKAVKEAGMTPTPASPLFVWHSNITAGRPSPKNAYVQFCALGAQNPLTDAVLIRTMHSLSNELGRGEFTIRINSMGDKETRIRFQKELTTFFRRHAGTYSKEVGDAARKDVILAARLFREEGHTIELPRPTDHLSESSRKHFETVLEYLEATDTPFNLAQSLIMEDPTWSETCFEISNADGSMQVTGSRFSELNKHFYKNANMPAISAIARFTLADKETVQPIKQRANPRFVFVHLGDEAKRECIKLTEELRRAKLPLAQSIAIESMTEQMRLADGYNPKYLIIMGRTEAHKRAVTLRLCEDYSEREIPLSSLVDALRKVA